MKKIIILIVGILGVLGMGGVLAYQYSQDTPLIINTPTEKIEEIVPDDIALIDNDEIDKEAIVQQKINSIKKRLALKGLIIEGDGYYRNQQLPLALKKYLEFYKQNSNDDLVIQKLGDTYFELKKYGSALNYYKLLGQLNTDTKKKLALSYIASNDITQSTIQNEFKTLMEAKNFNEQELFYYTQSLSCIGDFHQCKLGFGEYFDTLDANGIAREISYEPLIDLKKSLENYVNFQVDEVYLKDAYMISSWYSNGLYSLAIDLGNKLLLEKINYKPILKIVAQSEFELGNYEQARKELGKYYAIDEKDSAINYILGIVNEKLKDYVLANIYFQKSLDLGYNPSIDARRHIIHNFYLLQNDKSLLQAFKKMVEEEKNLQKEDLALAIYYHIIFESYDKAFLWSKKGQELFPEDGDFFAYEGWILREEGKLKEALSSLQAGGIIDEKNPFIFINIAYTVQELGNIPGAKIYFAKVISIAPKSDFASQAKAELTALEK
ncbi:hypothetical protein GW846_01210 [Candidatus Gracilibacteria bacterium]|nr:hypothetical protein [Candidatus Gracilibacteria bacterium]